MEEDDTLVGMTDKEIERVEVDAEVKAVVAGINYTFSYRKLCMASLFIQLNKAQFIATNKDKVFTTMVPERKMPAGGTMVTSIQYTTQTEPLLIGKPTTRIFETLLSEHSLQDEPRSKFLMIGDTLETDIKFGNNCGIDTLLVLSGNSNMEKAQAAQLIEDKEDERGTPTYIMPIFGFN